MLFYHKNVFSFFEREVRIFFCFRLFYLKKKKFIILFLIFLFYLCVYFFRKQNKQE